MKNNTSQMLCLGQRHYSRSHPCSSLQSIQKTEDFKVKKTQHNSNTVKYHHNLKYFLCIFNLSYSILYFCDGKADFQKPPVSVMLSLRKRQIYLSIHLFISVENLKHFQVPLMNKFIDT